MKKSKKIDLDHLKWAVERRHENQKCACNLLELLQNYPEQLKKKELSFAAQTLVGITFSLWRAAFLADKEGRRGMSLASARDFLEKLIVDNSINFPQDREKREWTFNYYVSNARFALCAAAEKYPFLALPEWKKQNRTPKQRWEYCQKLLSQAVTAFQKTLSST